MENRSTASALITFCLNQRFTPIDCATQPQTMDCVSTYFHEHSNPYPLIISVRRASGFGGPRYMTLYTLAGMHQPGAIRMIRVELKPKVRSVCWSRRAGFRPLPVGDAEPSGCDSKRHLSPQEDLLPSIPVCHLDSALRSYSPSPPIHGRRIRWRVNDCSHNR
jgi:hypothetical protein